MLGRPGRRKRKQLDKRGKHAEATVLEIAELGATVRGGTYFGDQEVEQVRESKLRVEPEGEPAFEVSGSFRYPNLAVPGVGDNVPVVYDPEDRETVMIGEIAGKAEAEIDLAGTGLGGAGPVDEASREEMLEEAKKWTDAFPDPNADK